MKKNNTINKDEFVEWLDQMISDVESSAGKAEEMDEMKAAMVSIMVGAFVTVKKHTQSLPSSPSDSELILFGIVNDIILFRFETRDFAFYNSDGKSVSKFQYGQPIPDEFRKIIEPLYNKSKEEI